MNDSTVQDLSDLSFSHLCDTDIPPAVYPLERISKRDKVWNTHRSATQSYADIYATDQEFARFSERLNECSGYLEFRLADDGIKLSRSFFCHVRTCPVCAWRKSLAWVARMHAVVDELQDQQFEYLFLTLTVKNCAITDLRATLKHMSQSFKRLTERIEFRNIKGFLRTTEVTRAKNNSAHPHFHIVLAINPSYFKKGYIAQAQWQELWRECLRVDYAPIIDIRKTRAKAKGDKTYTAASAALVEALKYALKPSDVLVVKNKEGHFVADKESAFWLLEYTKQVKNMRFVGSGGVLKDALKEKLTDDEMIHVDKTNEDDENADQNSNDRIRLNFDYHKGERKYFLAQIYKLIAKKPPFT